MVQTVYNWQMMQCLYLWTRVVSKAHGVHDCEAICELTYPLTQLIHGVLKLFHSLRYIPLRLHCISLLIQLQANCGTYVPTLALAVELLDDAEHILAKKPKAVKNAKMVDMECILKVGAPVLEENVWRSALCDYLFRITLQAAHLICSQPSFPDVIVPITHRIRDFLRKIRSAEYARCFRSLSEKLEEQAKFVADVLLMKEFSIKDDMQIMSLKLALNNPDSPLRVFYRQWEKAWRLKQQMLTASNNKEIAKDASTAKKPQKKEKEGKKEAKAETKPIKKKRMSTAAADRADETIPDQLLEDLGNWSDSN
ncbi:Noc2p family protein [Cooperia oncophora]